MIIENFTSSYLKFQIKFTFLVKSLKPWTKNQSNKKISELALAILKQWQDFYTEKDNLDMIEVKCDVQTEKIRKSSKRHLCVLLKNIDVKYYFSFILSTIHNYFFTETKKAWFDIIPRQRSVLQD